MLGIDVLAIAKHHVVLHRVVIGARLLAGRGDGIAIGLAALRAGEQPASLCVLVAHRVQGGQRLTEREVSLLVIGKGRADKAHQLRAQVVGGKVFLVARLGVARNVVVGPDDVVGLPQTLLVRGVVLIGEPAVVVGVGEERLMVAPEHHDNLAIELA